MSAFLVLEDGTIYEGTARGAFKETVCEIVFNTSMTGYLEILTDPSYAGQGIVMTYPMIGNYGISREDFESIRLQPCAFIVHELCDTPSNFRCEATLEDILVEFDIPCLVGVDTRSIVKRLRESGTMRGIITEDISDMPRLFEKIRGFKQIELVESVSIDSKNVVGEGNSGYKIALMDFGTKRNIAKSLASRGCVVTEYPCHATAHEIIDSKPDGIMLSNGPGDPADCVDIINEIKILAQSGIPTFAICLGHQLMALSQGAKTERMKYGHRGANHPVKFIDEDKTYLSSQNHGYMVSPTDLPKGARVNCINVNDSTVEGIVYEGKPIFTVQFHPEASPGPHDTSFLFDRFLKMIERGHYDD
ncbi:MAG: carbamoyl phosphate synthase small subunit [Oscillospiraceae bacterium]